ncbi:MAG: hypothetical protein JOY71_03060 [Acetobacteraceae bacterium]|nr:hypothetical protein [Acetobacteraceae bacterium]
MMLVAVTVFPFLCALFLFAVGFDWLMGSSDTPEIAGTLQQMHEGDGAPAEVAPKTMAAGA